MLILISVVMPVYNSEKYVGRAIESILNQTYRDIELIIINDGSTDSSGTIIQHYADKDMRIKVITQINSGVSAARNAGIAAASGEWMYFIDSDDYVDLCFFQEVIPGCESFDIIISGAYRHYIDIKKEDGIFIPPYCKIMFTINKRLIKNK